MAADLAYKTEKEIRSETKRWGLTECEFLEHRETQCFLAGNSEMILLAFRGTEPTVLKDWMTDIEVDLVGGPGGKVHEGFLTALAYVWRDIWRFIKTSRGRRSLWITGHSLGASVGALAVAKLRLEKDEPVNGLYTFGQPRTGDAEFARHFNTEFGAQTFRYVNNNDIVPRLPFRVMKYRHVGTFKYFDEKGKQRDDISWWDKLMDRFEGRIADFLEPGTDGVKDHSMAAYVKCLQKL
jgi:triacylglycerol lipase